MDTNKNAKEFQIDIPFPTPYFLINKNPGHPPTHGKGQIMNLEITKLLFPYLVSSSQPIFSWQQNLSFYGSKCLVKNAKFHHFPPSI